MHNKSRVLIDLIITVTTTILLLIVAVLFDAFEAINELANRLEIVQADELFVALSFLALVLAAFAFRRWRELQSEAAARERYAADLVRANEDLKNFAYIVSHDLRAPLINLKGFSGELRYAYDALKPAIEVALPQLDAGQRKAVTTAYEKDGPEALDFIETSVERMDRLIGALLQLSRMGRRKLDLESIDMNSLVHDTLNVLSHEASQDGVQITTAPLPSVTADLTSMQQIMSNLLTNAILYLDPDRPGRIAVSGEKEKGETTFHVRDNGIGIAQDDMDKVFAPFRRIGKQNVPGEGMGLAYVKALVQLHGGRIWCESEPGVGTTFSFTILEKIPGERPAWLITSLSPSCWPRTIQGTRA
jgi:signal transduction histidine kinase